MKTFISLVISSLGQFLVENLRKLVQAWLRKKEDDAAQDRDATNVGNYDRTLQDGQNEDDQIDATDDLLNNR